MPRSVISFPLQKSEHPNPPVPPTLVTHTFAVAFLCGQNDVTLSHQQYPSFRRVIRLLSPAHSSRHQAVGSHGSVRACGVRAHVIQSGRSFASSFRLPSDSVTAQSSNSLAAQYRKTPLSGERGSRYKSAAVLKFSLHTCLTRLIVYVTCLRKGGIFLARHIAWAHGTTLPLRYRFTAAVVLRAPTS